MLAGTVCLYACWHSLLVCLLARLGPMHPRRQHSPRPLSPHRGAGAPSCLRVWGPSMPACLGPQKLTLLIPKVNPNHHTFPQFHARAGRRKGRNFMPAQAVVMYDPATSTWRYGLLVCLLARFACMHAGTVCLYACWHGLLVCLLARFACMLAGTVGAHAMNELIAHDISKAGLSACMLVGTLACMLVGTVCLYACWHGWLVCLLARSGPMP